MCRLGVISCQILELELAHVLSKDPEVSTVWVVEDEFSADLAQFLERSDKRKVRLVERVEQLPPKGENGLSVVVRVMEVGLHANISVLKREVIGAVEAIAPAVDAVFLGYGLCGNALADARKLFEHISVPVLLPMDREGPVDDCVGLIIGGRESYYEEQCRCAGTMFMNPGFSRHWKKMMASNLPPKLIHKKDQILKRLMGNYERSLLLPTPVLGEPEMRQNIEEFNLKYNLRTDMREGTLALFEAAWKEAKQVALSRR
jgi:hypothetical protein